MKHTYILETCVVVVVAKLTWTSADIYLMMITGGRGGGTLVRGEGEEASGLGGAEQLVQVKLRPPTHSWYHYILTQLERERERRQ